MNTQENVQNLIIDPKRAKLDSGTGIYVRAFNGPDHKWESVDIAALSKDSLLRWLKSRGGNNSWAENVVVILLGHDPMNREI